MKNRTCEQVHQKISEKTFAGVQLKGPEPQLAYAQQVIDHVVAAMKKKFVINGNDTSQVNVINATKVLSTRNWPISDADKFSEYGSDEIRMAASHFQQRLQRILPTFSPDVADAQWDVLKRLLAKRVTLGDSMSCPTVYDQYGEDFKHVLLVIDALQTLPPTSVSCETSFSHMKLVKTSRRLRMREFTLNQLLQVKIVSPAISEFQPDDAVNQWLCSSTGGRRLSYTRQVLGKPEQPCPEIVVKDTEDLEIDTEWSPVNENEQMEEDISAWNAACGGEDSGYYSDYEEADVDRKILDFKENE